MWQIIIKNIIIIKFIIQNNTDLYIIEHTLKRKSTNI